MNEEDKERFIAHVEAILREQILELGEDPAQINPHEYAKQMRCEVHPDGSMIYIWRDMPILRIVPETTEHGTVYWRMYTQDDRSCDTTH